jgi:hypothetical protein
MCLFDEDDLFRLLKDEKLFSLFTLLEREIFILRAHILFNQTFASIGALLNITDTRAQFLYKRALKKIKNQTIQFLAEKLKQQNQKTKTPTGHLIYIAANGESFTQNPPRNLSVLAVGL